MPSRREYETMIELPQVRAALDTIAWAEGGRSYNTLYGGGTFTGTQQPNRAITAGGYTSTAAGRYQFLYRTWIEIKNRLGLPDFTARYQDIAAVDLIAQRGQLGKLLAGDFEGMMRGLGCAWAALPYATCGQTRRPLAQTMNYYSAALAVYGGLGNVQIGGGLISPAGSGMSTLAAIIGVVIYLLIRD